MERPKTTLTDGTAVVTCPGFVKGTTDGLAVSPEVLEVRSTRTHGTVHGVVPGTEAEAYFVKHDVGGQIAAYYYTEFELISENGAANRRQPTEQ